MKVAFLCGSFEPGRDGVGDYVAQFARALTGRGHECQVLAIADRNVAAPTVSAIGAFEVMRLPAAHWRAGMIEPLVEASRRFAADCVSLQMVSYAYEPQGLLLRSPRRFAALAGGAKRHLMLHELWLGESNEYGARDRLLGWLQKKLLLRTVTSWAPAVVHTSNPTYQEILRRNGIASRLLPLPGNVPVIDPLPPEGARAWLLQRAGWQATEGPPLYLAGVFGSIHAGWADHSWIRALLDACRDAGQQLALIHLGRAGSRGERIWAALRAAHGEQAAFAELGVLPAGELSLALQGLDLGIATSPWALAGKSGTVAAMLEHGVPVVVPRTDYRLRSGSTPDPIEHPLLFPFDAGFLELLRRGAVQRGAPRAEQAVYSRFLAELAAADVPLVKLSGLPA